jgi:hypothetical protein
VRIFRCCLLIGAGSLGVFAQAKSSSSTGAVISTMPASGFVGAFSFSYDTQMKGHPYSAEQDVDRVQTLADGTHITQATQKTMIYRDAEGRSRMEHFIAPPPGMSIGQPVRVFVSIMDPVAGYSYSMDDQDHVVHRGQLLIAPLQPKSGVTKVAPASSSSLGAIPVPHIDIKVTDASGRPHPRVSSEKLGTETMDGLTVEGVRTTVVYPEGSMGNDRPVKSVTETWTSTELNVPVLSKMNDPRMGESTTKLISISLNDPDPALFQIPDGYTIVDDPHRTATRSH